MPDGSLLITSGSKLQTPRGHFRLEDQPEDSNIALIAWDLAPLLETHGQGGGRGLVSPSWKLGKPKEGVDLNGTSFHGPQVGLVLDIVAIMLTFRFYRPTSTLYQYRRMASW